MIGVVHLSSFMIQGKCVHVVKDFEKNYKNYKENKTSVPRLCRLLPGDKERLCRFAGLSASLPRPYGPYGKKQGLPGSLPMGCFQARRPFFPRKLVKKLCCF